MEGKIKGSLPKSISTMVEFHTMYWTCPQCGIDFAVLVLHGIDKGEIPVSFTTAVLVDFCPFCGQGLERRENGAL